MDWASAKAGASSAAQTTRRDIRSIDTASDRRMAIRPGDAQQSQNEFLQAVLTLRFPLKAAAELQAQDIFRALAGARADRSRALHPQNGALQSYIGLFVDRFGDFGTHAGWGNVQASAADEAICTLAVLPDDLDGRRLLGSSVPSEFAFTIHFVGLYITPGLW